MMNKKWLLCDFHIHTKTFSDGKLSLHEVIDFYGKRQFDAICITDHAVDPVSALFPRSILPLSWVNGRWKQYLTNIQLEADRAWIQYKMIVVAGLEYTSYPNNQHIVGVDFKDYIKPTIDTLSIVKKLKEQNALVIGAHPWTRFFRFGGGLWKVRKLFEPYIDCWEIWNGSCNRVFPNVVEEGYPLIANSDFHKPNDIKGWKTLVKSEKNIDAIKETLRKNKDISWLYFR